MNFVFLFWFSVIVIGIAIGGLTSWWAMLLWYGFVAAFLDFGVYCLEEQKK